MAGAMRVTGTIAEQSIHPPQFIKHKTIYPDCTSLGSSFHVRQTAC
jgi:hypothetical protein